MSDWKERFRELFKDFVPAIFRKGSYDKSYFRWDLIAGITLAFFLLPESMAYATLAGMPPEIGIYCCMAGGLFYALFTSTRQVAIGPTSAISLMMGSSLAVLSGGDKDMWIAMAVLSTLMVSGIFLIAYIIRINALVNFISETILLGFKAGAALSIMSTQLPKLFGFQGGGKHFFDRISVFISHLPEMHIYVLLFGLLAILLMFAGDKYLPGRPVSLFVVIGSIVVVTVFPTMQNEIHVIGAIASGLPTIKLPTLHMSDIEGVFELSIAAFLLAYIETISSARLFALNNKYEIDSRRELLALSAANFAVAFTGGYPAAGGLSQSTVNDRAGAKSPVALIIASAFLALVLLFFTGLLSNLPEVILAAIVIHAIAGLIKLKELIRLSKLSSLEYFEALVAFAGVLVFGILRGVLLSVILSIILLLRRIAYPNVAVLGRIGDSDRYSDIARHPDNVLIPGCLILRIEASVLYFNAENIKEHILRHVRDSKSEVKLVVLDLSACSYVDVAGSKMLLELSRQLHESNISLRIVEALAVVRDMLRKTDLEELTGHISRRTSINDEVSEFFRQ